MHLRHLEQRQTYAPDRGGCAGLTRLLTLRDGLAFVVVVVANNYRSDP